MVSTFRLKLHPKICCHILTRGKRENQSTLPSFSGVNSWNLGTILPPTEIRPDAVSASINHSKCNLDNIQCSKKLSWHRPVAIAISSNSTPPTHRTAGKFLCISKWFASSSKPHWQITKVAPTSCKTDDVKNWKN